MKACKLLVHALVTSRLDYSYDVIKQIECGQRMSARVVCKIYANELLCGLHWLLIKACVQYETILLVLNALNTCTPPYLYG